MLKFQLLFALIGAVACIQGTLVSTSVPQWLRRSACYRRSVTQGSLTNVITVNSNPLHDLWRFTYNRYHEKHTARVFHETPVSSESEERGLNYHLLCPDEYRVLFLHDN